MKNKTQELVNGNEEGQDVQECDLKNKGALGSVQEITNNQTEAVDEFTEILKNSRNENTFNENILYRYYSEVGQYPLLTAEEEQKYGLAAREGDLQAWRYLFKGNLRLVIMIAQRYQNQGIELHDLISEGNLGVMHAISKFEPEKGFRFSTYAVWWIRHYLSNVIMNEGRTIRIPIHVNKAISRLLTVIKELSQTLNREPTINEISDKTGQSIYEIMDLMAYHESTLSLDATIRSDQEGSDFYHLVSDDNADDATEILIGSEKLVILQSFLHHLEPQARRVIEYRFGVNGQSRQTLEKTGELLGITKDQVRYSQMKALARLKEIFDENGIELCDILS